MAAHVSPEWRSKIIHGTLGLGKQVLMGSNAPPDHCEKPQGFSVSIEVKDPAEAERMFPAWSNNGKVIIAGDLLGRPVWRASRSVWRTLDGELQQARKGSHPASNA